MAITPLIDGHDLSPEECLAAARAAALEVDPQAHVRPGERQRIYELLWRTAHSEAWLVSWSESRDTGFHDHDGSHGAVVVLEGQISEEPLVVGVPPSISEYRAGESLCFDGRRIHRMQHDPLTVSIHVYSPPITRIGSYEVVDGVLLRTPGSADDESPQTPGLDAALAT